MGGGSKKKSVSMAEKAQDRQLKKEGEVKEKKESSEQKKGPRSVVVSEDLMKTIRKEAVKMNAVTPYTLASKYGLKTSIAKEILRELASSNLLRKVTSNRRTIVYVPVQAKPGEAAAA